MVNKIKMAIIAATCSLCSAQEVLEPSAVPLHIDRNGRMVADDMSGGGMIKDVSIDWERTGSGWTLTNHKDDTLVINCKLDVLGSLTPYFCYITIYQWPDGYVQYNMTLSRSNDDPVLCDTVDAKSWFEIENEPLPYGGFLRDVMSRFAGGTPPIDLKRLDLQNAKDEQEPSKECLSLIEKLGSDNWREREQATCVLWDEYAKFMPQLRWAFNRSDLSLEQKNRLALILWPQKVNEKVKEFLDARPK